MKSAIITLTKMYNYGNSLQNYAVQEVLRSFGLNPETIIYEYRSPKERVKCRIKKLLKNNTTSKKALFDKFEREHIIRSKFHNLKGYNKKAEEYFDFYFIGSDQVWNATWYDRYSFMKDAYLLTFTDDRKKIAYAASFGIDSLPDKWKPWFKENLEGFKAISVREHAGRKIVEELTEKKSEVLIDPTMMLDVDEWRMIERNPGIVDGNFVLSYFLSPKCQEAQQLCSVLERNNTIIDLMQQEFVGSIGPSEFLWLYDNAELVLTDSFHGSVFSLLLNKPFQVFDRQSSDESMNSRLSTLLSKFGLERKYASSGIENDLWEHEYSDAYHVLEKEREKALSFIRGAIV